MSDYILSKEIQDEIESRSKEVQIAEAVDEHKYTEDEKIECAIRYGDRAIENRILVSISENINIMAEAIKDSEKQKQDERDKYVEFFKNLLISLVAFAVLLIVVDTFCGIRVRIEFLVSVIVAIIADVFAIVQTLVKYMTNVENYNAYSQLIDSLLKHIDHNKNK